MKHQGSRGVAPLSPVPELGELPNRLAEVLLAVLRGYVESGQPIGSQYGGAIDQWALTMADEVAARAPELDERITAASEGWTADRLGAVERSALRVAIHELQQSDVPPEGSVTPSMGPVS